MSVYDPFRAYLHSKTLRWSHGAVRGRESDLWQQQVVGRPIAQLVKTLSLAGFAGIYLDRHGYADGGKEIEAGLSSLLGSPALVSGNDRISFFDMASFNWRLRETYTNEEWQAKAEVALHPVLLSWQNGFSPPDPKAGSPSRWCYSFGRLNIINPSERAKSVTLNMAFRADAPGDFQITIEGALLADQFSVNEQADRFTRPLIIPPGKHTLRFRGETGGEGERRGIVFKVEDFEIKELE